MANDKMTKFEKNLEDWRVNHPRHWVATTDKEKAAEFISEEANEIVEQQVKSTDRIIASQNRLENRLNDMSIGIDRVARGIENLASTFEWGFSELIWQVEQEREVLQDILETLQAPLDTEAKERRKRAVKAFHNGWMDDALEEFLEAEERNKFDFIVHFYLGNIYLNHKKDPQKALEYYQKAVKYSKPESEFHASYAFLNTAKVKYLLEDYQGAKEATAEAIELSPDFDFAHYEHARYSAKTSDFDEAIDHLKKVIKTDRKYALKANNEKDFEEMEDKFKDLIRRMRDQTKKLAEEEITQARKYIAVGEKYDAPVSNYRTVLERAENLISNDSLFDCQDALKKTRVIQERIFYKTEDRLNLLINTHEEEITEIKNFYSEEKEDLQRAYEIFIHLAVWGLAIFLSVTVKWWIFLIPLLNAVILLFQPNGEYSILGELISAVVSSYTDYWYEKNVEKKIKKIKDKLPDLRKDLKRVEGELEKFNKNESKFSEEKLEVGDQTEAEITKTTDFGAFIKTDGGETGLIHISELSRDYVKKVEDVVEPGDRVTVELIKIDDKNRYQFRLIQG